VEVKSLDDALKTGAMAVFDEKYEDTVRVVSVRGFSMELCGGTHMDNTGKIGVFKILREASPGAGMRRIEAITLKSMLDLFSSQREVLSALSRDLNITESDLPKRVHDLMDQIRDLEKELKKYKSEKLIGNIDSLHPIATTAKNTTIFAKLLDGSSVEELRTMTDTIKSRYPSAAVCLGSVYNDRPLLVCSSTASAVSNGIDCGYIIKQISPFIDGGGGGRKDMAQAGGKNPGGLSEALAKFVEIAKNKG
jgi:alanyl-tRNA synthetase